MSNSTPPGADPNPPPLSTLSEEPAPPDTGPSGAGPAGLSSCLTTPEAGPASSATPAGPDAWQRYHLLRPHARGGLGEVFVALDMELRREVALKAIQEGCAAEPLNRQRFVLEAEITNRLEHPGVVPVYGLGQHPDGRPFYAMRFIRGDSLREAIRHFHADRSSREPGEHALALRQLLGRFLHVCNTIAYAHSRGVVHRDLKPHNIMLGPYGETLVVDWGLAKLLGGAAGADGEGSLGGFGEASATRVGAVVGTPAYMSPEQAAGRPDLVSPASDVYGLGATLYALLTGRAPFPERDLSDTLTKIQKGDFPPPRQVTPHTPAALDAICRKAMALRPEGRYPSALDVARDIERWLADEPVSAYREPWPARARRWLRRHRTGVTAAAAAFLVAAVVGGGACVQAESERATQSARALARVIQAEAEADRLWQAARPGRDRLAWEQALAAARHAEALAGGEGPVDMRPRLEALRARVEREAEEAGRDANMVARLEEIRIQRAEVRSGGFAFYTAIPAYAEAFRAYGLDVEALEPEEAGAQVRARRIREELVSALDEWAWLRSVAEAARPDGWQHLLAVARTADPDPWRNDLRDALEKGDRQALKKLASTAEVAALPLRTLELLGHALGRAGAAAEAATFLRRAQREHPTDFWINQYLAYFLNTQTPPQPEESVRFYTAAVALRGDNPGVHVNLAGALLNKGALDEAQLAFEKAVALKPDYVAARIGLSRVLRRRGQAKQAAEVLEAARRLAPEDARVQYRVGVALVQSGATAEGQAVLREAIRLDPGYVEARLALGHSLGAAKAYPEAVEVLREARKMAPQNAEVLAYLGASLSNDGKVEEAVQVLREAVRLKPDFALAHKYLAVTLGRAKQADESIAEYRKALDLEPDDAEAHAYLAGALKARGKPDEAVACYREALRLKPDASTWHNLGLVLNDQKKDRDGAIAAFREALRLRPNYPEVYCNLGHVLQLKGEFAEALEMTRRGHELGLKQPGWRYPSATWVRKLERLAASERKLNAVLRGEATASPEERIELAQVCALKKLYGTAAKLCEEAFAAKPALAEDLRVNNRYNAACLSAQAGCGRGGDAGSLSAEQRARWRHKALGWLRADLSAATKLLEEDPAQGRKYIRLALPYWHSDEALACVRDREELAALPAAERAAWQELWSEAAALLSRAGGEKEPLP